MKNFFNKLLPGNLYIWLAYFGLLIISIICLFSASSTLVAKQGSAAAPIMRHITFLMLGFISIIVLQKFSTQFIRYVMGYGLLIVSWILLVLAMFIGEVKGGATRSLWGIQPSELARLALIISTASFMAKSQDAEFLKAKFHWFVVMFVVTLALVVPSNLSTTILLAFTIFVMLFIGRIPWRYIFKLLIISGGLFVGYISVSLVVVNIYPVSKEAPSWTRVFRRVETWQARVVNFSSAINSKTDKNVTNPYEISDEEGINNRQSTYALIAIARGGLTGVGIGDSNQKNFLPEAYSDFIFAIICEESGLVGILIIFIVYFVLFFSVVNTIYKSKNLFHIYMSAGCMVIMITQILVHCLVCLNLFPLTGQPLPLISNGGSSIVINSIYIGIFIYTSRQWKFISNTAGDKNNIASDGVDKNDAKFDINNPAVPHEEQNNAADNIGVEIVSEMNIDDASSTEKKDSTDNSVTIEIE